MACFEENEWTWYLSQSKDKLWRGIFEIFWGWVPLMMNDSSTLRHRLVCNHEIYVHHEVMVTMKWVGKNPNHLHQPTIQAHQLLCFPRAAAPRTPGWTTHEDKKLGADKLGWYHFSSKLSLFRVTPGDYNQIHSSRFDIRYMVISLVSWS